MKPAFNLKELTDTAAAMTSGVHGYHDREDAQQEFILGALEAQAREKRGKAVRALQWGYAQGYVKKFLKANQDHLEHVKTVLDSPAGDAEDQATLASFIPARAEDPLEVAAGKDRARAVRRAVMDLPVRQRDIILARFFQGLPLEEVAKKRKVTKQCIQQEETKAMQALRVKLLRLTPPRAKRGRMEHRLHVVA